MIIKINHFNYFRSFRVLSPSPCEIYCAVVSDPEWCTGSWFASCVATPGFKHGIGNFTNRRFIGVFISTAEISAHVLGIHHLQAAVLFNQCCDCIAWLDDSAQLQHQRLVQFCHVAGVRQCKCSLSPSGPQVLAVTRGTCNARRVTTQRFENSGLLLVAPTGFGLKLSFTFACFPLSTTLCVQAHASQAKSPCVKLHSLLSERFRIQEYSLQSSSRRCQTRCPLNQAPLQSAPLKLTPLPVDHLRFVYLFTLPRARRRIAHAAAAAPPTPSASR